MAFLLSLDIANNTCYSTARTKERGTERTKGTKKVECSRFSKELPIWSLETAKLRIKNKLEK